ncbi:MAG: hypothetical protein V3U20_07895, partial [Thermoplasmata archaeon]
YWTWGQDIIERAKKIRELEEGVLEETEIPSDYREPFIFRLFDNKVSVIVCAILIPIVLFSTYSMGTMEFHDPFAEDEDVPPPFDVDDYDITSGAPEEFPGTLAEGETTTKTVTIRIGDGEYLEEGEILKSITFELTWEDEGDEGIFNQWENQPDEFRLTASQGGNYTDTDSGQNPQGGMGSISITFEFDHDSTESINGTGEWLVEITLVSCGGFANPLYTDDSNSYELVMNTEIYSPQ